MATRKKTKKPKAKKIKLLKVEEVAPGKHRVELEIEGAPEPFPGPVEEPILVHSESDPVPEESGLVRWWKSLF